MTLRKLDIKVETVNREPLTLHTDREEDTASVSTATRVMKAIYSVRGPTHLAPSPKKPEGGPAHCHSSFNSTTGWSEGMQVMFSLGPFDMMAQTGSVCGWECVC